MKQVKLGVFLLPSGQYVGAWRRASAVADAPINFAHISDLVRTCEAAKLDFVFLADSDGLTRPWTEMGRDPSSLALEPMTLLAALASITENIGLVGSVSTEFNEPFHVARKLLSLDQISGGRAGWNLVTSAWKLAAANFGQEHLRSHADRYERAIEFVEVVKGLWDSIDESGVDFDKATGEVVDLEKVHVLGYRGRHFQVEGPLNLPRSPQGHPVIVQAGSSEPGRELAARTAEVIFTAQSTIDDAKAFYADVKGRLGKYGRSPDDLKIMPGIFPIVGKTMEEAQTKSRDLAANVDPDVALSNLSMFTGTDLSGCSLDEKLPDLPETEGHTTRRQMIVDKARQDDLTLRELFQWFGAARGHFYVVGTAETIADQIETWLREEAADGFNLMVPDFPNGLTEFCDLVVPELQRRGLFRTEYEGPTLRANLGLQVPANPFL
ncbi:LLM class flavin-dependent oxidoreductase [Amorphus sp. 3PC139-8]|uniref:LLM class flavin-dependent oxidoreductase n=1 Tax=Amorphus sp. 3PC139-8 TaxID=2735676 RepID=UPI00345CE937